MAEKKYLDLTGLTAYNEAIKELIDKKDAAILDAAEALGSNYDPAGSAATAEQNAKTYADGKDAAISAAQSAADAAQGDVDALEAYVGTLPEETEAESVVDYITARTSGIATDTALEELQTAVDTAESAIDAIEADYLTSADKTELQGSISTVDGKVTTLVGADTGKSARTIANEELAAQLIPEDAQESLNTLQEIADWIQDHPGDASAMNTAITALQTLVGTIPEEADSETIVAYIQELVNDEQTRATAAEGALDTRLDAVEATLGSGSGSVTEQIATAKQEAITAAASDATTKANQAEQNAKTYADGLVAEFVAITPTEIDALFTPAA